jgi:pimeloyl-ACP methyl ester carboxylesterase
LPRSDIYHTIYDGVPRRLKAMTSRRCDAFHCWLAIGLIGVVFSGTVSAKRPDAPATLRVGSITLVACPDVDAYCGRLDRPMDPTGAISGRISIHFEYYLHTAPDKSIGTLVATEGGPGYPATLSRDDYLALFEPLRTSRDFVLMDNRGTGRSAAIDCHVLQTGEKWTIESVAGCGKFLGIRAALYSTIYAADDLAAILAALHAGRIDLYGDSYGTYFEQVFAIRHPELLRSIVLDGAYPLDGPDYAWYPNYAPAMRAKFNIACQRSDACAKLPGSSIDHISAALARLRAAPFMAHAVDSNGNERTFTANASQLAIVMFGSAPAFATVRELDAAARAFMEDDRAPLLRLMAETITGVDSRDPTADATKWSAGLAAAVMCQDPPQIFDMRLEPALRARDLDRAIAQRQRAYPDTYAPFTIDEYRGMPLDYSFIDQCVAWPVSPPSHPAPQVAAANAAYPDIPALIISGEFDNMTTGPNGEAVAQAFRHGRHVLIANSLHVNALPRARSACGADIVRRFIETLDPGDLRCASAVPAVRLVPRFAKRVAELDPAIALQGNSADAAQLRLVAAAVLTVGDVLARADSNSTDRGKGLRGGSFQIARHGDSLEIVVDRVRWTDDLEVSGTIDKPAGYTSTVRARLDALCPGGAAGRLKIHWEEGLADARALIAGEVNGNAVAAQMPAP